MDIFKIAPLLAFIYLSLIQTIERNKYPLQIESKSPQTYIEKETYLKKETSENSKLRKKVVLDLKYHEIEKNYNKTNVLHITINQEGRIVGYKPCNIFYPNYFTKNQLKQLINMSKKYNLKKIHLCMIKIKFYHAKIDL